MYVILIAPKVTTMQPWSPTVINSQRRKKPSWVRLVEHAPMTHLSTRAVVSMT